MEDDYGRRSRGRTSRRKLQQRSSKEPLFKRFRAAFSKVGTLNIVLLLVFAFFLFFNFQMIELFRIYGTIPETYACSVVAATIGECGICGWIKTNKDRKREHGWEQEERRRQEAAGKLQEEKDTIQEVENG